MSLQYYNVQLCIGYTSAMCPPHVGPDLLTPSVPMHRPDVGTQLSYATSVPMLRPDVGSKPSYVTLAADASARRWAPM